MTQPERSDSNPAGGQIRFTNRAPDIPLTRNPDGYFIDAQGNLFSGWVWLARDHCWYGQRMTQMDKGDSP